MGKRLKFVLQIKLMFLLYHPNTARGNHHIIYIHTQTQTFPVNKEQFLNASVIIKTVTEQGP